MRIRSRRWPARVAPAGAAASRPALATGSPAMLANGDCGNIAAEGAGMHLLFSWQTAGSLACNTEAAWPAGSSDLPQVPPW
jgi:hypothetical protein